MTLPKVRKESIESGRRIARNKKAEL